MTVGTARPLSLERTVGPDGHVDYVANYGVTVTDPYEFPDDVSTATGIPFYGDFLTWGSRSNQNAICSTKTVKMTLADSTNLERIVTCTFTTRPGSRARSGNNVIQNPIDEPWEPGGSYVTGTQVTGIDKDGAPILTTGKEQKFFDVPDGYDTLQLQGPSRYMSLPQRKQAMKKCNSVAIWGLAIREVYLAQWQWKPLFHRNTPYFYHRMEFWIKDGGWNEVWLNKGTQEFFSGPGLIRPIIAVNDSGGTQERFLDANGIIIPDDDLPTGVITNTTKVIGEFDFTALTASIGLPNPLPGNFI